jgi:hypothetical protein
MPSRVARLRMDAKAAERAGEADKAKALRTQADTLVKRNRRAALAAKKAAEVISEQPPKKKQRTWHTHGPDTIVGRIDARLETMGKTRHEMESALGFASAFVARVGRSGYGMRPENLQAVAKFLGVTPEWLRTGEGAPPGNGAALIPHASTVFKTNGKGPHGNSGAARMQTAMAENVDTAMNALWGTLPLDVRVFLLARMAELVAMKQ